MDVTEVSAEGLKREFKITVPASDLDERLTTKLHEMKGQVHLKGFRPGKVPVSFLKKTYGKSLMGEIVEQTVAESRDKVLADRDLRPALQPKIDLDGEVTEVLSGKADLAYTMAVEVLPDIEVADLAALSLERLTAEIPDEEVEERLKELAESQKNYVSRDEGEAAQDGDRLTIDFKGDLEGEPFEGGSGDAVNLVLGSNMFIPGFEEQLVGVKKGDEKDVDVTFPDDYNAEHLAGKKAHFAVTVQDVAKPEDVELNDDFAAKIGIESLEKLRELMTGRIRDDYDRMSRLHMKRHLLDALDERHAFELPEGMVEAEFAQIWRQVEADMERRGVSFEDEETTEEAAKTDYRNIAERRVRLGLVLSEIGRANEITVSQDELARAVGERARQFPGQEQQVYQFFQQNPAALQEVRAPLFEDKVVDFIVEKADVTDKTVSKDELFAEPDDDIPGGDTVSTAGTSPAPESIEDDPDGEAKA